jgi:hypothetical protein
MRNRIFLRRASEKNATSHFLAQSFGRKKPRSIFLRRPSDEKSDVAFSCADLRTKTATQYFLAQAFGRKMPRSSGSRRPSEKNAT